MKRRAFALCLALCLGMGAVAGASDAEAPLETYTTVTFEWGGLALLDEAAAEALGALLESTELRISRWADGENGYASAVWMLQEEPALDFAVAAQDGMWYERSTLLGDATVACTEAEFAALAAQFAQASGGMLPAQWGTAFAAVMSALAGGTGEALSVDAVGDYLDVVERWREGALDVTVTEDAHVMLPGLSGVRTETIDVTREEALALAEGLCAVLGQDAALWDAAVAAQMPGARADVAETMREEARALAEGLPAALAEILAADMPPAEYRRVYAQDGTLACSQVVLTVPGETDASLYLEWAESGEEIAALYARAALGEAEAELLLTLDGMLGAQIAQCTLRGEDGALELLLTRTREREESAGRAEETVETVLRAHSGAGPDEAAQTTLVLRTQRQEQGEGAQYTRRSVSTVSLEGFGTDEETVVTVTANTRMREKSLALAQQDNVLYLAGMDEQAREAWIQDTKLRLTQAWFSVLSRLPRETAAFLLAAMEAETPGS